jgi:hypothetical protein
MLNRHEQILFNTVKNLVKKLQHQCHLIGVEPDELIQVGCITCLEAKTPTSEIKEVAKKAILKYYYQERNLAKKQTNHIKIGKNDNKKEKNLVEEVLPAPTSLTDEEREEQDKQQGLEWEDLPETLPQDLKHDILIYRDKGIDGFKETLAFKSLAYRYRKKTINYCNEVINQNSWVLKQELDRAVKADIKKPKKPFCKYILRHSKLEINAENLELARLSFNCPLVRTFLNKADSRFETFFSKKEVLKKEQQIKYNKIYAHAKYQILKDNDILITNITRKIARSNCPLLSLVIKDGSFLKKISTISIY